MTRLAVLIDADNTTASLAAEILAGISKYGTPTIKRAYGDWTRTNLTPWSAELRRHAIQRIQADANGKNSADFALIIDAMDLLYTRDVEGFAIVSSDRDFTRLATRLREAGKAVYGVGRHNTHDAFVSACDDFVYIDRPSLERLLSVAITSTVREGGWSPLSAVGLSLRERNAAFRPRDHGHAKLSKLLRAALDVEFAQQTTLVRLKR